MKRSAGLLITLLLTFWVGLQLSAQCSPDPACADTLEPGESCPAQFPQVIMNEAYDQVITFMLALEFEHSGTVYTLDSIAVDSIRNIPPGMTYTTSAAGYVPEEVYCSQLAGTPTEAGDFALAFYLEPFIDFGSGPVSLGQFVDDTSIVITVIDRTGIDPFQVDQFRVLPVSPNPYSEITRLGFYTPFDDRVQLQVFNILGERMHEELLGASPGEHHFEFNGNGLLPGTYFYRVTNAKRPHTGKFIKTQ
jgi:hypothetical protein